MSRYSFLGNLRSLLKRERLVAALILAETVLGVLVKQIYLGPATIELPFFYGIHQQTGRVLLGVFLGLVAASVAVGILLLVVPIIRERYEALRKAFIVTTAVVFVLAAAEMMWILGLLLSGDAGPFGPESPGNHDN